MQSQWIFISGQWKCERQRKTTTKGQKHKWTIHFSTECIGNGDFYQFDSASSKIFSQFRVSLHFCKKPNVWGNFFPRFCVKSKKFEMCWLCVSPHLSVRTNFQQRLSTFLGLYRGEYIQYNIWGNIFNTISGGIYSIQYRGEYIQYNISENLWYSQMYLQGFLGHIEHQQKHKAANKQRKQQTNNKQITNQLQTNK